MMNKKICLNVEANCSTLHSTTFVEAAIVLFRRSKVRHRKLWGQIIRSTIEEHERMRQPLVMTLENITIEGTPTVTLSYELPGWPKYTSRFWEVEGGSKPEGVEDFLVEDPLKFRFM